MYTSQSKHKKAAVTNYFSMYMNGSRVKHITGSIRSIHSADTTEQSSARAARRGEKVSKFMRETKASVREYDTCVDTPAPGTTSTTSVDAMSTDQAKLGQGTATDTNSISRIVS